MLTAMNRVLLNTIDHADLRVAIRAGAAFGDDVNQAPIFPSEFEEAQRAFPIIFREEDGAIQPYALLGLDRDENLFLAGDRWTSDYVPVFQRRGPFSIAVGTTQAGDDDGPMVHLDLADPRVGAADGLPLFKEHGGTAPLLDHMTEVLRTIYQGMETVAAICAAWRDAGLLRPITLQIALDDGRTYEVPDIFTVDRQALADLSGEPLERLHRHGLLAGAILAAASLGNVQRLIALKAQRAAR
ncbi:MULTISPECIES: SapC family protein [unclassified Sphingomonas]|uniref:SapC family protein n=1 Tax=unclassified Sphingomonas TaxID=196159 RepID=UPI00055C3DBF|nr:MULTISPECIES: SapC family protein [unclassified Sphingomonas]